MGAEASGLGGLIEYVGSVYPLVCTEPERK